MMPRLGESSSLEVFSKSRSQTMRSWPSGHRSTSERRERSTHAAEHIVDSLTGLGYRHRVLIWKTATSLNDGGDRTGRWELESLSQCDEAGGSSSIRMRTMEGHRESAAKLRKTSHALGAYRRRNLARGMNHKVPRSKWPDKHWLC